MKETDPVGNTVTLSAMDAKVDELMTKWTEQNPAPEGWFGKIKNAVKASYSKITRFLIDSVDELVLIVEGLVDLGPDKKATVLAAVEKLYDAIVAKSLPTWAKPFSPIIRKFVINVLVSSTIDFIVGKYKEGAWKPKDEAIS